MGAILGYAQLMAHGLEQNLPASVSYALLLNIKLTNQLMND